MIAFWVELTLHSYTGVTKIPSCTAILAIILNIIDDKFMKLFITNDDKCTNLSNLIVNTLDIYRVFMIQK